ncbi:hypothetical protein N7495_008573 [Penicillium taxi]|uniref:uncharacterized protein n=1 Tax=Penicillium taxi TaxID=168475 RepID=UPI002544E1B5|nr:uncharacterized protein N7495_008573 [Penicillium taxi]KAJ5888532.1 hypothetical protein N7495_008573 [Penicillium taxi]
MFMLIRKPELKPDSNPDSDGLALTNLGSRTKVSVAGLEDEFVQNSIAFTMNMLALPAHRSPPADEGLRFKSQKPQISLSNAILKVTQLFHQSYKRSVKS